MSRSRDKSRKAISPTLATVLLVLLASAAIVATYAWIMTYTSNSATLCKAHDARFYDNGTRSIEIDVGNNGTSDTHIIQVHIGTTSTNLGIQTTKPPLPILARAGTSMVTIIVEYNWTVGSTYFFKIVPREGRPLEWSQQANIT